MISELLASQLLTILTTTVVLLLTLSLNWRNDRRKWLLDRRETTYVSAVQAVVGVGHVLQLRISYDTQIDRFEEEASGYVTALTIEQRLAKSLDQLRAQRDLFVDDVLRPLSEAESRLRLYGSTDAVTSVRSLIQALMDVPMNELSDTIQLFEEAQNSLSQALRKDLGVRPRHVLGLQREDFDIKTRFASDVRRS